MVEREDLPAKEEGRSPGAAASTMGESRSAEAAALTVGATALEGVPAAGGAGQKRPLSPKAKVGISLLAVIAAVCVGVGAFALAGSSGSQADFSGNAAAVVADDASQDAADGQVSGNAGEGSSADDASASEGDAAGSTASGGSATSSASGNTGSSSGSSSGSSDQGAGSGSSASGSAASSGNAAGSSSGGSASAPAPSNRITVYVSVSSSEVGNPVSGGGTFTFEKGATAYDALCACGLSVSASSTAYGVYVAAVGGLAEKEHGANSGWMYSVNGTVPMTSCSNYQLSDGDSVAWYYTAG